MDNKKSFILFTEYAEDLKDLSDEQFGQLMRAIFEYENSGSVSVELDAECAIAFKFIARDLDRAREKYTQAAKNGQQGGAPVGNQNARKQPKTTENNLNDNVDVDVDVNVGVDVDDNNIIFDKSDDLSCAEPRFSEASAPAKTETKTAISLPLKGKHREFNVTQEQIKQWAELYPAVNITQELRSMKGWLLGNPTRQKTKSGILRFINSWLAKEQNRGSPAADQNTSNQLDEKYIQQVREYINSKKHTCTAPDSC